MRVLLISPRTSGIGGVAQHVGKLAQLLRAHGHEVDVISCENTPYIPLKNLMNPSFALTSAARAALSRVRGARYDVVHAHNVPSALAMRVAKGGRVLTLHGVFSEQVGYLHGGLPMRLGRVLERWALGWADAVTAVSRQAAEYYSRLGFNVAHVPNAVDPSDLPSEGVRLYDRQVVYTGRLSREKGVDVLVRAFMSTDLDAHLLIVGSGPLEPELRRAAERDPRIHVLGFRPRPEALKLVRGSDVFVLPSRHEGLSTSLLEAMAMGIPPVATRVGGNVEVVEHGRTGLLVEPDDPAALAEAIRVLIDDPSLAAKLGNAARALVESKYSWGVTFRQYLSIYEKVR